MKTTVHYNIPVEEQCLEVYIFILNYLFNKFNWIKGSKSEKV